MSFPGFPDPFEATRKMLSDAENRVLDRITRGLGDTVRSMAADIGNDLVQRAQDLIKLLESLPHAAANAVADAFRGTHARTFTGGEPGMVVEAYSQRVNPSSVRIVIGIGLNPIAKLAFMHGNPAITVGNTIYIRADRFGYYGADELSRSGPGIGLLIHESMHVNQFARFGFTAFSLRYLIDLATHHCDPGELYDYEHRKLGFEQETLEGQAQIVGNYAQFRNSADPSTRALAARAEARLKGTGIYGK